MAPIFPPQNLKLKLEQKLSTGRLGFSMLRWQSGLQNALRGRDVQRGRETQKVQARLLLG